MSGLQSQLPLETEALHPPNPMELASLAVQLAAAGIVEKSPAAAMAAAADWWIAASKRCRHIEYAEIFRSIAISELPGPPPLREMTEAEVMNLDGVPKTPAQFRKRAREFFLMNWAATDGKTDGLPIVQFPRLYGFADIRDSLMGKARLKKPSRAQRAAGKKGTSSEDARWLRPVAESFAEWLRADRTRKGRIGGNALHGKK